MKREPEVIKQQLREDVRSLVCAAFEAGYKACECGLSLQLAQRFFMEGLTK